MKFGGTSVGSTERIGEVAKRVTKYRRDTGEMVVVVVSAMSGETDRLIELSRKVGAGSVTTREYDQLLASGEQVTAALTAMAITRLGIPAVSMLAPQVPILTASVYGQSLIRDIPPAHLDSVLESGAVPVVAGFQGIGLEGEITTLGRGGSDTTAVAVAAALGARECIIFTDVEGVYTALPSICKQARKLNKVTYEEMLELASSGAKVLQTRSVHLARKFKVKTVVASSFTQATGTEILEEYEGMEDAVVSGITCRTDEAKLTLRDFPDRPGNIAKVFSVIAAEGVLVDMIIQSQGSAGRATISFTIPDKDAGRVQEVLQQLISNEMPGAGLEVDKNIAKLAVVGEGMRTHTGVAAQMFEVLGREGINIDMITTSEIMISVAIHQKYAELAVRTLHEHFIENRLA